MRETLAIPAAKGLKKTIPGLSVDAEIATKRHGENSSEEY